MNAVCHNENCQKEFTITYEGQKYCGKLCKRARTMRNNRAKKNMEKFAGRQADIKVCEYCHENIIRNPRISDYHWEVQKFHKKCYKKAYPPGIKKI